MSNARAAKRRQTRGRDPVAVLEPELDGRDLAVCDALDRADDEDLHPNMANYDAETTLRMFDAMKVQNAYIDMLRLVKCPIDERGRTYDLRVLDIHGSQGQSGLRAIFYTMVLLGFTRDCQHCGHHNKSWIKPRPLPGGVQTWVDIRAPGTAEEELRPEHKQEMVNLPPDVRGLAAKRDGEDGLGPQVEWHAKANVEFLEAPRPEDW
jgi:hypothetical protein